MLRAQTSGDAEGSTADPNTDAVFLSTDQGRTWRHVAEEPVQKRMCHPYPLTEADAPALASLATIGATLGDVAGAAGTLCVPYAFHPPSPAVAPACQELLDAYCNNETLNGPVCIDPQLQQFNRSMEPYYGLYSQPGPAWRCYSHEAVNPAHTEWSAASKTPAAYCSGSGRGLVAVHASPACKAAQPA